MTSQPVEPRARILVADDDPDILALVSLGLERAGYAVIRARDGEQALELARTHEPDLAVLDVSMPARTGYEVTRELRARDGTRATRVVLLTARAGAEDAAAGLDAGADAYVTKPFSPRELLASVEALLP